MKILRNNWLPITLLLLWLLLSWFLGSWIGLHGSSVYYLRGGLAILGIIGFIGYLLMRPKTVPGQGGVSGGEMDDNLSEAAKRLQAGGVKQIAAMPAVFFIGDTDSAKTSVIAKSDIAQLLSGQAQQEIAIVPTRAVNFWIARNTLFVDLAGALLNDSQNRTRLFKRFSAVALQSIMGSRRLPPRSVVFTVSCETLLQVGGADAMAAKARQFQTILAEMAQEIGSRFPVYVLFTKADKLAYFRDFVENLSEQEAAEVFGVTLPLETQQGVYGQQQTSRLNDAFQRLYFWLADRRPAYLAREHRAAALPNIYEFPREFGKLRPLVTSFLVDLCRPSQLGVSPFLRGFYFTGIRAISVNDVAPAAVQVPADDSSFDSGATRMFKFPSKAGVPQVPEARESGARKMAQWVYLSQFLPAVVLADSTATTVGASNVKLNVARRVALGVTAALALLMGLWWIVSFTNNRALIHGALDAARNPPSVASLDALQRLTAIKDTLETLNSFDENGRPLSYAAFLYSGDDAHESVSKAYYGMFHRLLLAPTQENLRQVCAAPSEGQPPPYLYDTLKAYLMTTQYHAKTVPEFLTPALLLHWKTGHTADPQEERLAKLNFDFYSRELLKENKYWPQTTPDAAAVGNCRDYLNRLGQTDPIYRRILVDAGAHAKAIVFNDEYPGSEATVLNRYRVEPAFTKIGFDRFQELLKNIKLYANGEDWVLEPKSSDNSDHVKLSSDLQQLYKADFIKIWTAYLQATRVKPLGNVADAIAKLDKLSSGKSALLQALCLASENTTVSNPEIRDTFQPAQSITPAGCSQGALVSDTAKPYMTKLVNSLEALKTLDPDKEATFESVNTITTDLDGTVKGMALNFKGPTDATVEGILRAPIYQVVVPVLQDANKGAAGACRELQPILNKYPFNSASHEDATLLEVDGFLKKPEGLLWKKLVNDPAIAPLISQIGDTFSAKTAGRTKARDSFLAFLTRAATLSHVLYGQSGQAASFKFTMSPVPSPDVVEHVTLKINGLIQSTDSRGTPTKEFEWNGNTEGVDLLVRFKGGSDFAFPNHPGLWGLWHFMDSGTEIKPNEFEWKLRSGPDDVKTPKGDPVAIRFTIDPAKAAVMRPRYFRITCVPTVN